MSCRAESPGQSMRLHARAGEESALRLCQAARMSRIVLIPITYTNGWAPGARLLQALLAQHVGDEPDLPRVGRQDGRALHVAALLQRQQRPAAPHAEQSPHVHTLLKHKS